MNSPTFDTWTSAFLFFSILGTLLCGLLWIQNPTQRSVRIPLILVVFLFSFTIFDYVLYWTGYQRQFPYFSQITPQLYFAYGPLFLIWFRKLAGIPNRISNTLPHFIPLVLALLIVSPLIFRFAHPWHLQADGSFQLSGFYAHFLPAQPWVAIAHLLIYAFIQFRWHSVFSGFEPLRKWTITLSIFFTGFATAFLSYYLLVATHSLRIEYDYMICGAMCLFILGILYIGYISPQLLNDTLPRLAKLGFSGPKKKYAQSPISDQAGQSLASELRQKVQEAAIWRKSDVSLDDLAGLIVQPRQYVSQILNEQFGQNFYEFINGLRIDEAKAMLENPGNSDLTVLEIAYATGFNNKVSFYKAFRGRLGMTPTEFRQSISDRKPVPAIISKH